MDYMLRYKVTTVGNMHNLTYLSHKRASVKPNMELMSYYTPMSLEGGTLAATVSPLNKTFAKIWLESKNEQKTSEFRLHILWDSAVIVLLFAHA